MPAAALDHHLDARPRPHLRRVRHQAAADRATGTSPASCATRCGCAASWPTRRVSSATRCWPELGAKTFWTVSVWEDEPALRAFAAAEPHRAITRRSPGRMGASAVRDVRRRRDATSRCDWADVRRRLAVGMTGRRPYHHGNLAAAAVDGGRGRDRPVRASPTPACAGSPTGPASATRRSGGRSGTRPACWPPSPPRATGCSATALDAAGRDMLEHRPGLPRFAERRPALFAVMFQPAVYRADDPGVVAARARTTALLRGGRRPAGRRRPHGAAAIGAWALRPRPGLAVARRRPRGRPGRDLRAAGAVPAARVYSRPRSAASARGGSGPVTASAVTAPRPAGYRSDPNDRRARRR